MTTPPAAPTPPPVGRSAEAAVLVRTLARTPSPVVTTGSADPAAAALAAELVAAGWQDAGTSEGAAPDVELLEAGASPSGTTPRVVAVLAGSGDRVWPDWDQDVVGAGYVGCLRTGGWRLYAREDVAADLGPALGHAASDEERWPDGTLAQREELLEEIIAWRTAALNRWAERSSSAPARVSRELEDELNQLRNTLGAMRATVSWRVTAPLRRVQAVRLQGRR